MSAISPLTFQHTKQSLSGFKMAAGLGVVSELKTLEAYISVLQAVCTLLMNTYPTLQSSIVFIPMATKLCRDCKCNGDNNKTTDWKSRVDWIFAVISTHLWTCTLFTSLLLLLYMRILRSH